MSLEVEAETKQLRDRESIIQAIREEQQQVRAVKDYFGPFTSGIAGRISSRPPQRLIFSRDPKPTAAQRSPIQQCPTRSR